MIRVAGTAISAAPTTTALAARPDTPAPPILAASKAPTDNPIVTPTPPIICVVNSTRTVWR
jgi:hypothetical protein